MTNFVSDIIDNKWQLYLIKVKWSNNKDLRNINLSVVIDY